MPLLLFVTPTNSFEIGPDSQMHEGDRPNIFRPLLDLHLPPSDSITSTLLKVAIASFGLISVFFLGFFAQLGFHFISLIDKSEAIATLLAYVGILSAIVILINSSLGAMKGQNKFWVLIATSAGALLAITYKILISEQQPFESTILWFSKLSQASISDEPTIFFCKRTNNLHLIHCDLDTNTHSHLAEESWKKWKCYIDTNTGATCVPPRRSLDLMARNFNQQPSRYRQKRLPSEWKYCS